MLMEYDRVYVFGQAKSHCVLSTLNDLQTHLMGTDPRLAEKIWILEDAMSPVPAPPLNPLPEHLNFPAIAEKAIAEWQTRRHERGEAPPTPSRSRPVTHVGGPHGSERR